MRTLFLTAALIQIALGVAARAEESFLPPGWKLYASGSAARFIFNQPPNASGQPDGIRRGVEPLPPEIPGGAVTRFDVRGFFANLGVELPKNAAAIYDRPEGVLTVLGPKDDVDFVEQVTAGIFCGSSIHVEIEAVLAEFSTKRISDFRGLPARRVQALAGKSWRDRDIIRIRTKSGHRAVGRSIEGMPVNNAEVEKDAPNSIPEGQTGTVLEVEPVIGPDALTIDMNMVWKRVTGSGETRKVLDTVTSVSATDGSDTIVNLWPSATAARGPVRAEALILRVRLVDGNGDSIRQTVARRLEKIRAEMERKKERSPFDAIPARE